MKIWGEIPKLLGIYDKLKNTGKADASSGITQKRDVVSISSQAKDFQTVLKAIKEVPDMRVEKVNALTEKIESNNYNVNSSDIADKIIRSVFDKKV